MSYNYFAMLYDTLMEDVPYESWLNYIDQKVAQYGNGGKRLLDLGCGTGTISIPLALQGYEVTGVDLSDEMLTIAQEKASVARANITFFQQDMRELAGFQSFDCIGIFCDSLNYLQTEEDVLQTFTTIYKQLSPQGLILFDVHSIYKINDIFIGQTYARNDEEISYIWNCYQGETANSVEHELSFFVQCDDYLYERFDEVHFQRTFSIDQYVQMLSQVGFEILEITADFKDENPSEASERIFFTAKKTE
ncbi:class I SAM-dependent DNA methyltransferase [Bacillus sp. Marseille-P3661]|uniref:class I SAM-dependent DNA methyltransferase n=1 Tax=Bacillus sp. Marseille-P3661 TaxID=1936234 RepID=UPI000C82A4ED|nr:class I SAM-dependent methyltransferase [Bacillus sp. Marseille-P3661]